MPREQWLDRRSEDWDADVEWLLEKVGLCVSHEVHLPLPQPEFELSYGPHGEVYVSGWRTNERVRLGGEEAA